MGSRHFQSCLRGDGGLIGMPAKTPVPRVRPTATCQQALPGNRVRCIELHGGCRADSNTFRFANSAWQANSCRLQAPGDCGSSFQDSVALLLEPAGQTCSAKPTACVPRRKDARVHSLALTSRRHWRSAMPVCYTGCYCCSHEEQMNRVAGVLRLNHFNHRRPRSPRRLHDVWGVSRVARPIKISGRMRRSCRLCTAGR